MNYIEAGIEVIKLIEMNGYEAFFVGGFVRDYLLGVTINDIDITTNALPSQIANIFKVVNTGIKYNSVVVEYEGYSFETTTYRLEGAYLDYRHPTYEAGKVLSDDLRRRDFTINAMAMDKDFNIIDNFGGKDDLRVKLIRTVYDPVKRFNEDALRMLRACYFAAKLNFNIENETFNAIKKCSYLVQSLSNDRITWELEKIIDSDNPEKGLRYLKTTNILPYLVFFRDGINLILERGYTRINWLEFMGICFYNNPLLLNEIHLKSGLGKRVKEVIELAKKCPKNDFSSVDVFDYGIESCYAANTINIYYNKSKNQKEEILNKYNNLPIYSISELKVRGQEILDTYELKNKKDISEILKEIKEKVLTFKLSNDKEEILMFIKKHYSKK